jgi:outer membrane protein
MTVQAFRTAASVLVFAATGLAAPTVPADSMPSRWHGTVGAGTGIVPDYLGSDGVKAMVLPAIDAYDGRFFASTSDGVGINLLAYEPYNLFSERSSAAGIAVTYGPGRDENDGTGLRGTGDIEPGAEIALFGRYRVGAIEGMARIRRDVSAGHGGAVVELSGSYFMQPTQRLALVVGPALMWADRKYNQAFLGVSATQSARSGLPQFDVDAGVNSVALNAGAIYSVTDNVFVGARASVGYIVASAADSPIVQSDRQLAGGLVVGYRF